MERSRRQRLSELYGQPVGYAGTPGSLRQRLAKEELERDRPRRSTVKTEETKTAEVPKVFLNTQQPLIPTTILDVGSQRAFVLALIAISQAYKLYDLILFKNNLPISPLLGIAFPSQHFNFITKHIVYDSALIYFLPALRIPSLTFKRPLVMLQIITMILVNLFLASEMSFPITSVLLASWKKLTSKDLTVLGSSVKVGKLDTGKHFKGSHTIKILPENTLQLNPFQDSFCLQPDSSTYQLNVPIRLNSSSEIDFLQVKYTDFDTNTPVYMNYTKKDIKRFDSRNVNSLYERDTISGPNIHYLNLPIKSTGLYEITQAADSKKVGLRTYRSPLIVPYCPTAEIKNFDKLSADKCLGESYNVKFSIEGVPPLKLKYKKLINHDVQEFNDQSLQPEFFQSPLLSYTSTKMISREHLSDLSWAKTQVVDVELENPVNHVGDYTFRIDEIVDGLGNVVNYAEYLKDNDDLFKKYGLSQSFFSHDLPKVHLDERVNEKTATKRSLFLAIDHSDEESGPFEAEIKFVSEDESKTETIKHVFKDSNDEFKVEAPGTYTLVSVKSKFCAALINGRSSVSVSLPVVPQLTVVSKPVTDSCVGQVGLVFDLSFVGTPPFSLEQKVYRIQNDKRLLHSTKNIHSQGTRYRFTYEPSMEGSYEIAFTSLRDSVYSNPITLDPSSDYTFTTSMRVKSNAELADPKYFKHLCLGIGATVPVSLKGEAPFTLDYDIIETLTNKRTPYTVKDIKSNKFDIKTPEFKIGGEYIVSLTAVEDNTGCLVNLNGADANIKVRRELPSVSFGIQEKSNKLKIKEGDSLDLPLRLLGDGSFEVSYDLYDFDGNFISSHQSNFRGTHKSSISVSKAGVYKLKSVKDSQCSGIVGASDVFEISYLPKPTVSIAEQGKITKVSSNVFEKKSVCQYQEDSIDLVLQGSPPFVVDYTIVSPDKRRVSKSLSVATKFASLILPNDKGGEYKYFITRVSDAIYSKQDLEMIHHRPDEIVVKQQANASPNGSFKSKRKSYRTCTTNLLEPSVLEPIGLKLEGASPFSITFEVFHESSSKSEYVTLNNIDSTSDFKELYRDLKLGNHLVTIVKIVDADGCFRDEFADNNYISISITDTPKIHQLDSSANYCVGDHVGYQLIGTAPFTIVYDFNGLQLKTTEQSTQFVRLASEPGTISIRSIEDSSSNCIVNLTLPENFEQSERLSIPVHPIPSVEVSQGDSIIQDIHEGDQAEIIFSFEGTPPFTLTYVRTEEVEVRRGKKKTQVVETHKVADIYTHEYRVLTSLQGTYEAIEVSDAYCVARNE